MSVIRFSIPLAGGNHNVVFAFDYDSLLAVLRQAVGAMEAEMDEWDRGLGTDDIMCSDEYKWRNKDRYESALAAAKAKLSEEEA